MAIALEVVVVLWASLHVPVLAGSLSQAESAAGGKQASKQCNRDFPTPAWVGCIIAMSGTKRSSRRGYSELAGYMFEEHS